MAFSTFIELYNYHHDQEKMYLLKYKSDIKAIYLPLLIVIASKHTVETLRFSAAIS